MRAPLPGHHHMMSRSRHIQPLLSPFAPGALAWLLCLMLTPSIHALERPNDPQLVDPQQVDPQQVDHQQVGWGLPLTVTAVVVSANRFEQESFEVDRTVQSIDQEGMRDQQVNDAPSAMQEATGVMVQRTNRGAGAPVMRGLIGPRNVIVVDGVRFNNATFRTGPNQYLTMLDPVSFARYEALLGPASVQYGSDAMGGVLQAVTHPWTPGKAAEGEAGLRFTSQDLSTAVWGRGMLQRDGMGVAAAASLRQFGELTSGGGTRQPISDYLQGGWSLRLRRDLGPKTHLAATWIGARLRDAGRADRISDGDFRFYDNDDDLGWFELRHEGRGALRKARVTATFHRTSEDVDRYRCKVTDPTADVPACTEAGTTHRSLGIGAADIASPLTRQTLNRDTVWSPGGLAMVQFGLLEGRATLNLGLEGQVDLVTDSTLRDRREDKGWAWKEADRGNFSEGSSYTSLAAFAQVEADLWTRGAADALVGTLGGRLTHIRVGADDVPGVGDLRYDHTGLAGSVGLRWLHGERFMAYVNASQGFRAPNLQEATALGDTGSKFEVPNAALAPERSDAIELGGRYKLGNASVHVAGFFSVLDDVIDEKELDAQQQQDLGLKASDVGGKPVIQRVNSVGGTFVGAEATVTGPEIGRVQPWARGSWLRGDIARKGETVPARRTPPAMGSAGLRYQHDRRWHVELYTRFAGRQDRLHPSDTSDLRICEDPARPGQLLPEGACQGTAPWWTLNLRGGFAINDHLRVDALAGNVMDFRYRTHGSGYDEPGRGVSASVVGRF